jgi:hypothetical protein
MTVSFKQFKARSLKSLDAWTEVLIVDTLTSPLAYIVFKFFKHRSLPYILTALAFSTRLIASIFFFSSKTLYGGLAFFTSIILDSIDGKVSRAIHYGKDPTLRGTLDFTLDTVGLSLSLAGLIHCFINSGLTFYAELTSIIAVLYYLNVAFTSSKFRLIARNNLSPELSLSEMFPGSMFVKMYWSIQKQLGKYRLMAHPSSVDAEFLLFVIGSLTNFNSSIIFLLCIIILVIDSIVMGFVPTLLLARKT